MVALVGVVVCAAASARAGHREALVAHCVQAAAQLGVPLLYLYCQPGLVPFYQRLGWQTHTELLLGPMQIVVMRIAPGVVTQ